METSSEKIDFIPYNKLFNHGEKQTSSFLRD